MFEKIWNLEEVGAETNKNKIIGSFETQENRTLLFGRILKYI